MDVMIDLETMGTSANAAIVAIGAVKIDIEGNRLSEVFYRPITLQSAVDGGGEIDPGTVVWWLQQSEQARKVFTDPLAGSIGEALRDFNEYLLNDVDYDKKQMKLWGNGADFDNVILASAYRRKNYSVPWEFWNNRCYRTLKSLSPDIKIQRQGTYHNALDDAVSQAEHLLAIFEATKRRDHVA